MKPLYVLKILGTEYWDIGGPLANKLNEPTGWKKYTILPDPWNIESETFNSVNDTFKLTEEDLNGVVTERIVVSGSSKLGRLPDIKKFTLTKLSLNMKVSLYIV